MLSRAHPDPDRPADGHPDDVAPALEDLRAQLADALERLDDAVDGAAGSSAADGRGDLDDGDTRGDGRS